MAFVEPQFDSEIVDLAGDYLLGYPEAIEFFESERLDPGWVIDNWRACHAYPLNTFQMTLRHRTRNIDPTGLVAQRIKRVTSIQAKLEHPRRVKLSEIQDIAGCRVIVSSVPQVMELMSSYRASYRGHVLNDYADYLKSPKATGYRGYHLIYCYGDPKHPEFAGLKVEMQFRTSLQHCWATAVETASLMTGQEIKAGHGEEAWGRFFALMSSAIARREGCRLVPRTPRQDEVLVAELRDLAGELNVIHRLEAFREAIQVAKLPVIRHDRLKYIIMVLDLTNHTTRFYAYPSRGFNQATAQYAEVERLRERGQDAVLVSVSDVHSLQRAYPNYFGDTRMFVETLREVIS